MNNVLYFDKESEQIEVRQFGFMESIDRLILSLIESPKELAFTSLANMNMHSFEEFEDGLYEYLIIYDVSKEDKHLIFKADQEFSIGGSVIFIKRKIHSSDDMKIAPTINDIVSFSPKEINLFANWFGMAFLFNDNSQPLKLDLKVLETLLPTLSSMDEAHSQVIRDI